MKTDTDRLIDDSTLPVIHTAIARVFMPAKPPVAPEGVDVLVTARDRLHEPEVIRVAAFCAIWSLIATGCFLPWGGAHGWWVFLRAAVCLVVWLPVWALAMQMIVVIPGALCAILMNQKVLSRQESLLLSSAMAVLIFSIAASLLLVSSSGTFRIVGGVWLSALALEGILRVFLLVRGLLR